MDLRSEFPVLERIAFLNAGSDGPMPQVAAEAAKASVEAALAEGRGKQHFERRSAAAAELRELYAAFLGAPASQVALTTSTSEGISKVIVGLEPTEILTSEGEHPGLIGPLLTSGARIRTGPLTSLADHVTPQTSLVACSHVGWVSGEVADPRLADVDVPVLFDGAQGIGAVPIDLEALGCAAYAGAGQKWLCGADGTGMLWVHPDLEVRPRLPAYDSFADPLRRELHTDARVHDTASLAHEVLVASVASTRLLLSVDDLFERAASLAERFAAALADAGRAVAPRGRTTLVSWEDPDPETSVANLSQAGVIIRNLPGTAYLRASVGAWNDETDLDRLLEALA